MFNASSYLHTILMGSNLQTVLDCSNNNIFPLDGIRNPPREGRLVGNTYSNSILRDLNRIGFFIVFQRIPLLLSILHYNKEFPSGGFIPLVSPSVSSNSCSISNRDIVGGLEVVQDIPKSFGLVSIQIHKVMDVLRNNIGSIMLCSTIRELNVIHKGIKHGIVRIGSNKLSILIKYSSRNFSNLHTSPLEGDTLDYLGDCM